MSLTRICDYPIKQISTILLPYSCPHVWCLTLLVSCSFSPNTEISRVFQLRTLGSQSNT